MVLRFDTTLDADDGANMEPRDGFTFTVTVNGLLHRDLDDLDRH